VGEGICDIYVGLILPDGNSYLTVSADGSLSGINEIKPFALGWTITPGTYQILGKYTIPLEAIVGRYQVVCVAVEPGQELTNFNAWLESNQVYIDVLANDGELPPDEVEPELPPETEELPPDWVPPADWTPPSDWVPPEGWNPPANWTPPTGSNDPPTPSSNPAPPAKPEEAMNYNGYIFESNSGYLTHPLWPLDVNQAWEFDGWGNYEGYTMIIKGVAREKVFGIQCLKMEQTIVGFITVYEWWAQDSKVNIHKVKSQNQRFSFTAKSETDFPNIKYAAEIKVNSAWTYYLADRMPDGAKKVLNRADTFRNRSWLTTLVWQDGDGSNPEWTAREFYLPQVGYLGDDATGAGWLRKGYFAGTLALKTKSSSKLPVKFESVFGR
jgi:hypothetical protein